MSTTKKSVIILCTGNSCRSQMAEYLINARLGTHYEAVSAGTRPSGYVHPNAVRALAEIDIDLSMGQSQSVDAFADRYFDYVITVCGSAKENCPVWMGGSGQQVHIGFEDPADATGSDAEVHAVFRRVRDEIITDVLGFLEAELSK